VSRGQTREPGTDGTFTSTNQAKAPKPGPPARASCAGVEEGATQPSPDREVGVQVGMNGIPEAGNPGFGALRMTSSSPEEKNLSRCPSGLYANASSSRFNISDHIISAI
jgi:hypothetical protein